VNGYLLGACRALYIERERTATNDDERRAYGLCADALDMMCGLRELP
jgi:hypothetical protein